MNIKCIMHADFETPGTIEKWAQERGHRFSICKPYHGKDCLSDHTFDMLIVLGGPQSPIEIEKYPYLKDEISLIRTAIERNKIVLGFCLGAQLIGEAMGSKTECSLEKEVGVFPITLTEEGKKDPLFKDFPIHFPVIHWHNDMPGETAESVLLAYSEGCPRQVIRYTPKVYGFQCHLEITLDGMSDLIHACPESLEESRYTQTVQELLEQDYEVINKSMFRVLDRIVSF